MQDFFANCATVLQKVRLLVPARCGHYPCCWRWSARSFGCLIGFAVGALQTIPVDKQRDPVWKRAA